MPKGLVNESSLNSIGTAINVLNGTEGTYTPSEMAPAIIDAIPTEAASGNPIHITDAAAYPVQECVTTLEPVQDLHGYDKPWIGGTGKNLCPPLSDWSAGFIKNDGTIGDEEGSRHNKYSPFIKIEGTASIVFSFENGFPQTGTTDYSKAWRGIAFYDANKEFINRSSETGFGTTEIIVSIPQNAAYIIVFCRTFSTTDEPMVEIGSTATAYEPYSNICPITGHTGVELTRTGKNLFSSVLVKGKNIDDTGSVVDSQTRTATVDAIKVIGNLTYMLSYGNSDLRNGIFYYDKDDVFISYLPWGSNDRIFTTPQNAASIRVVFNVNTDIVAPQLECGSTATAYEPYQGETHSVTFPQEQSPVYGGEVDWTNGVLRVTDVNIASYNGETLPSVWISDRDVYAEGTTPTIGAQVVYELATPIEIPLTPEVITLLKGENNIFTDSGTSEIEYKVDLQSYIQKLIDEASGTASALSVSPLSLGKSAAVSADVTDEPIEEGGKAEEVPVEEASVEDGNLGVNI